MIGDVVDNYLDGDARFVIKCGKDKRGVEKKQERKICKGHKNGIGNL